MKRDAVRSEVNAKLKELGYRANQYRWFGAEIHVVIGGEFRTFRFAAGKAKKVTALELGRLIGWHEAFDGGRVSDLARSPAAAPLSNGGIHAHV